MRYSPAPLVFLFLAVMVTATPAAGDFCYQIVDSDGKTVYMGLTPPWEIRGSSYDGRLVISDRQNCSRIGQPESTRQATQGQSLQDRLMAIGTDSHPPSGAAPSPAGRSSLDERFGLPPRPSAAGLLPPPAAPAQPPPQSTTLSGYTVYLLLVEEIPTAIFVFFVVFLSYKGYKKLVEEPSASLGVSGHLLGVVVTALGTAAVKYALLMGVGLGREIITDTSKFTMHNAESILWLLGLPAVLASLFLYVYITQFVRQGSADEQPQQRPPSDVRVSEQPQHPPPSGVGHSPSPSTQEGEYGQQIKAIFSGELGLAKTFWIVWFVPVLILKLISDIFGFFMSVEPVPFPPAVTALILTFIVIAVTYKGFALRAVWLSTVGYQGLKIWWFLARTTVVIGFFWIVIEVLLIVGLLAEFVGLLPVP